MTFQIVCQTVNRGCSLMTRILHMQIMIQVTLNHVLVRTYWIWTQTNVLKQNICWQDVAQGLIPLLLPISHKGRHSGGTGFNKITWCNNWRQTLLELPHWKTNQKDRLWNRGHETCQQPDSPSDLASYIPSFSTISLWLRQYCWGSLWKNCRIEQLAFWHFRIMTPNYLTSD